MDNFSKAQEIGSWIDPYTRIDPQGLPRNLRLSLVGAQNALAYAHVANDVYGINTGKVDRGGASLVKNWIELIGEHSEKQDKKIIGKISVVLGRAFGFNGNLYKMQGQKYKYCLAFEGSTPLDDVISRPVGVFQDWIMTNIPTVFSSINELERYIPGGIFTKFLNPNGAPATQYDIAMRVARAAVDYCGIDNIVIAGHSLGGGLTQFSCLKTGVNGIVFNSAGIGGIKVDAKQKSKLNSSIVHVCTSDDFVNDLVIKDSVMYVTQSKHFGVTYVVGQGAHGMDAGIIPQLKTYIYANNTCWTKTPLSNLKEVLRPKNAPWLTPFK